MKTKFLAALSLLPLVGCGPYYEANRQFRAASPEQKRALVAESCERECIVSRDDFKKFLAVEAPAINIGDSFKKFRLSAERIDGASNVRYFLTFSSARSHYESWAFWKEIYDQSGAK